MCSGLARRPLTAVARVRIPSGLQMRPPVTDRGLFPCPGPFTRWGQGRGERRAVARTAVGVPTRPGCRPKRSAGPDTDTAARTRPDGADRRADRRDTGLPLAAGVRPAPPAHPGQGGGVEAGAHELHGQPFGVVPGEQDLAAEPALHRHGRADGDRVAQAVEAFGGRDADAVLPVPAVQLGALALGVPQGGQQGPATATRRSSPAAAASSACRGPRTKRPCRSRRTSRWCSGRPPGGARVGRASPVVVTSWASWPVRLEGVQHQHGLVEDADSATLVHEAILASQSVRRKV